MIKLPAKKKKHHFNSIIFASFNIQFDIRKEKRKKREDEYKYINIYQSNPSGSDKISLVALTTLFILSKCSSFCFRLSGKQAK